MDISHLRRAAGPGFAGTDYRILVATVQAWQISTATARAESRCTGQPGEPGAVEPAALTRILLGSGDWRQAVLSQGGSFNPLFARCAERN